MALVGVGPIILAFACACILLAAVPGEAADDRRPHPPIALEPLPYEEGALAPHISAQTIGFHHGKHHRGYVDNLNRLIAGTPLEGQPLETIIRETAGKTDKAAIFNNAAQVWNHDFFWRSMRADGGGQPKGPVRQAIETSFGSYDAFRKAFVSASTAQFGSGWVWLVQDGAKLVIVATSNADTPLAHGQQALLTCDVWEHAYYLDYQNRRKDFVEVFLDHLVNWEFAASRLR